MSWQKIETAPRDGSRILYWNKYDEVGHCWWCEASNENEESCWWDDARDDEVIPKWWMAALPSPQGSEGE